MVYNFNLGIGWASSGVEYAQAYRAGLFREMHEDARFIFTDMFPQENIEHMTRNIGFLDREVIWLYTFFTDFAVEPVTYTRQMLERTFPDSRFTFSRKGKIGRYEFPELDNFYTVYFVNESEERVHRVEYVSRGYLIRKDYFTSARIYTEYYAPKDRRAELYLRRFFNRDGTCAYEEIPNGNNWIYRFPDQILYSKEELVGYMVRCLHPTRKDVLLIDRTTGIGQSILENAGDARIGVVVHADHYSASYTNDQYILWNNYYEYPFSMARHISFFVNSTEAQSQRMREQFRKYVGMVPDIRTIPAGALDRLRRPEKPTGAGETCRLGCGCLRQGEAAYSGADARYIRRRRRAGGPGAADQGGGRRVLHSSDGAAGSDGPVPGLRVVSVRVHERGLRAVAHGGCRKRSGPDRF